MMVFSGEFLVKSVAESGQDANKMYVKAEDADFREAAKFLKGEKDSLGRYSIECTAQQASGLRVGDLIKVDGKLVFYRREWQKNSYSPKKMIDNYRFVATQVQAAKATK